MSKVIVYCEHTGGNVRRASLEVWNRHIETGNG